MELCLNVLLDFGVFWVGLLIYAASTGDRFGFDMINPKQKRKIIAKIIANTLMTFATIVAIRDILNGNYWQLPGAIFFTFAAGFALIAGLIVALLCLYKSDSFGAKVKKIITYPICVLVFFSSFYFLIALVILFFKL